MDRIDDLPPEEVLRLGVALWDTCRRGELTMQPHGPRRLARCVRSLCGWLLAYLRVAIKEREEQGAPKGDLAQVFARLLRSIHQDLLGLLASPDAASFPTELVLPFKELLCRVGGYDQRRLSFAIINQTRFNFGVRAVANLLEQGLAAVESALSIDRPREALDDIERSPARIIVLTQPSAESRNILAGAMLLHELGHAIDSSRAISSSLRAQIMLPAGADSQVAPQAAHVTELWLQECVADLVAVRLFGPSVTFSLRRLSLLMEALDDHSHDHPSSRIRVALMLEHLRTMGYFDEDGWWLSELLGSWQSQCEHAFPSVASVPAQNYAREALFSAETRNALHQAVRDELEAAAFDVRKYRALVGPAVADIRSGLPPVVEGESETIIATVTNAAWEVALRYAAEPLDFLEAKSEGELALAMEAIQGLALKGIEASYALAHWKLTDTASPHVRPIVGAPLGRAILSESEIRFRLKTQRDFHIVPVLDPDQISKSGVDLRLGSHFIVTRAGEVTHFVPSRINEATIHRLQEPVTKGLGYSFVLHPGRLVLGATLEYIALPDDLAALVLSRSSYGRLGLLVATAIFVHPRWKGCLTLELANYSEVPVELRCGEPVAQLVLLRAEKLSHMPAPSPRSGLCPIRPQFPTKVASPEESLLLDTFAKLLEEA